MNEEHECGKPAVKMVYWPGRDPLPMCLDHTNYMERVAQALGLYVRTEQPPLGELCTNKVSGEQATVGGLREEEGDEQDS